MPNYQVRTDVFPASLTITPKATEENPNPIPQVHDKVRVVLTLDHIFVFRDDNPAPSIAFEDRLESYTPPLPATRVRKASQLLDRSAQFTTDDYEGSFIRMSSCGCGSRLKTASLTSLMPNNDVAQAASKNDSM